MTSVSPETLSAEPATPIGFRQASFSRTGPLAGKTAAAAARPSREGPRYCGQPPSADAGWAPAADRGQQAREGCGSERPHRCTSALAAPPVSKATISSTLRT